MIHISTHADFEDVDDLTKINDFFLKRSLVHNIHIRDTCCEIVIATKIHLASQNGMRLAQFVVHVIQHFTQPPSEKL